MLFIDKCNIQLQAGNGGNGLLAWRREPGVPLGGPYGGNGGNGGNIFLVGDHNETTLSDHNIKRHYKAINGINGQTKKMHGSNGEDLFVKVPIGTVVTDAETGELLADFKEHGQTVLICHGGRGGNGNAFFKSRLNSAPRIYENGDIGEYKNINLELKYMADIGLVGFPNVGKSTLISKISQAKPKIANYRFTTLTPILGTVYENDQRIIFADIPGLIEGASEGKGLGHEFLRHIERCKILVHVVSLDEIDSDGDVVEGFKTIENELKKYSQQVANKPILVIANKNDAVNAEENLDKLKKFLKKKDIICISALDEINLDEFKEAAVDLFNQEKKRVELEQLKITKGIEYVEMASTNSHYDDKFSKEVIIEGGEHVWNVKCEYLQYWAHRIPLTTPDNILRFNQKVSSTTLMKDLHDAGAVLDDTINIGNISIVYED